jgi:ribonuclease P protein component
MREAHVPAEQPKAQEAPRLPVPHAKPGRSGGAQGPTPARPHAPVGLIWRVRDRATFSVLVRAERHARGPVTIRYVPGESGAPPRVAYAVGGVGNAVVRNRLRRRLRAAVASAQAELTAGGAYLVSGRREALTMPFDALVEALAALFRAAGGHP